MNHSKNFHLSEGNNLPFFVDGAAREVHGHPHVYLNGFGDGMYRWNHTFEGSGRLLLHHKKYTIDRGVGFLLDDGPCEYYNINDNKKWSTYWVRFNGKALQMFFQAANLVPGSIFYFKDISKMDRIMSEIISVLYSKDSHKDIKSSALLYKLLTEIAVNGSQTKQKTNQAVERYISTVIQYMRQNAFNNVSLEELASVAQISVQYLCKIFHLYLNTSPLEYFIGIKMSIAKSMLEKDDGTTSIKQIAETLNIASASAFGRTFKKNVGVTPGQYRKMYNQNYKLLRKSKRI